MNGLVLGAAAPTGTGEAQGPHTSTSALGPTQVGADGMHGMLCRVRVSNYDRALFPICYLLHGQSLGVVLLLCRRSCCARICTTTIHILSVSIYWLIPTPAPIIQALSHRPSAPSCPVYSIIDNGRPATHVDNHMHALLVQGSPDKAPPASATCGHNIDNHGHALVSSLPRATRSRTSWLEGFDAYGRVGNLLGSSDVTFCMLPIPRAQPTSQRRGPGGMDMPISNATTACD
jgi:hypothetical protein